MGRLPSANATGLSISTLAALQQLQAAAMTYPGWSTYPPINCGIIFTRSDTNTRISYIPPKVWWKEAPYPYNNPPLNYAFQSVTVQIEGAVSDQDTYWYNQIPYSFFLYADYIQSADLSCSVSGYGDTQQWNGTSIKGEFTTANMSSSLATKVDIPVNLSADDLPVYQNDTPVSYSRNLSVVLPNACVTSHVKCKISSFNLIHIGDVFTQEFFYRPVDVSASNPAPDINYARYKVEELGMTVVSVASNMVMAEVQAWLDTIEMGDAFLSEEGTLTDSIAVNRYNAAEEFGFSFMLEGTIEISQGSRTIDPVTSTTWYLLSHLEFVDTPTNEYECGECWVTKQSFSKTSSDITWVGCN